MKIMVLIKLKYLFALTLVVLSTMSFSQKNEKRGFQIGGFFGASDYSGDLANNPLDLKRVSVGGGGYFGYYLGDGFQARARVTYQNIKASWEYESLRLFDYRLRPNVYLGAGVFTHNPKADLNGRLVELQPLGTEGQGIEGFDAPYDLKGIVIPFGAGIKYLAYENLMLEFDIGSKKVFTDYLDDVSGQEYVPPSILIQNGQDAVDLGYRADEIGGIPFTDFEDANIRRVNPRNTSRLDDWYYLFSVGGSYYFRPGYGNELRKNRKGVPNKYSRY